MAATNAPKLQESGWSGTYKKCDDHHFHKLTHLPLTNNSQAQGAPSKTTFNKQGDINANTLSSSPNDCHLLNRPRDRPVPAERLTKTDKLILSVDLKQAESEKEKPAVVVTRIQPHLAPVPPARTEAPRVTVRHRSVRTILNPHQQPTLSYPSKRGAPGPLTTTSDEDSDQDPTSPRDLEASPRHLPASEEYENVTSPGELTDASSTCSGPVYEREPGFEYHAHTFVSNASKPRQKKKKATPVVAQRDVLKRRVSTPPKLRSKKDPVPMRLRALPQSFWQQPSGSQQTANPSYLPSLPPLLAGRDDVVDIRPVTPPEDKNRKKGAERKLIVGNVDLLSSLFEVVDSKAEATSAVQAPTPAIRRMRTKKTGNSSQHSTAKGLLNGNDPCLVEAISDSLFPQLSLENAKSHGSYLQVVTFKEGDRTVNLPSLQLQEPNYQQMLQEVAMNI